MSENKSRNWPWFVFLAAGIVLASQPWAAAGQDADILWPQSPVRIDRSKQTYERLPAQETARDSRIWILVAQRVKIIDSSNFSSDGTAYRIDHLHPVQPKRLCSDAVAGRWPCGRMGAVLLGNLVRGKRLLCDVVKGEKATVISNCLVGGRDIAASIVSSGFAQALGDEKLLALQTEAQKKATGLWRNPACLQNFDHC